MRKLADKIKQLSECSPLDLHWDMLAIEHDTVLIVIHIRRILEAPLAVIDRDRDNFLPDGSLCLHNRYFPYKADTLDNRSALPVSLLQ